MKSLTYLILLVMLVACSKEKKQESLNVSSPSNSVNIQFGLTDSGKPYYLSQYKNKSVTDTSYLGIVTDQGDLSNQLKIVKYDTSSLDNTWEQPWGEQRYIRNYYKQLKVTLASESNITFDIIFRAYDDGIAYRYNFPEQTTLGKFAVLDEKSEFKMTDNHPSWSIPAYKGNRYEYIYQKKSISELDSVHTPFTVEATNGLFYHIHEAALYDYASMVLKYTGNNTLACDLVPISKMDGTKAYLETPFKTPWRTLQIGETAGDLITNYMILNLNEPNKLEDVSWIKPGKYVGVWWEMFIGIGTWHQGDKHAANTENVKKYIDFASKNGFDGVLVEGWNYGWDGPWMGGGTKFEFTKPYPDYDIQELSEYAKARNVYIIGHHETGADIENYEDQLEEAFPYLNQHGIKAVKTGYVENGDTLPNGYYHHGQYFVQHFQRVIETAAKNEVMVVAHEPIKDTGKRRTYPNMVSREGAKGQEYNAMGGNPTSHVTVLPFTRCLSGPFDYTPGVFDILLKTKEGEQVETTIGKELALYTTIYAPMMMANDLPENYEGHPAFEYIKRVPTDWETTKVLGGQIGKFVTIARQERDSDNWFVGGVTNETPRQVELELSFLNPAKKYTATIYGDAEETHYIDNPTAYQIKEESVDSNSVLTLKMAAGGGFGISIIEQ